MNLNPACPKCAAPFPADDPQGHCPACLAPGGRFAHGRYTLYEPLERSRIGVLWRASDEHLDGYVTLRFLAHDLRADPAAMEAIRLDVERARRLLHPNIARVHELHEEPDEPAFLVAEWFRSGSLADLLRQQPQECFGWPTLEPILLQLSQALDHAHREGTLHGNLNAASLRIDHEGRLKVTGFGFASLSGVATPAAEPECEAATQPCWSPQQYDARFAETADDIYALGALAYELLSGRPPFYVGDIASQVRHVLPKPLEERLADFGLDNPVPPHVAAALLACLAKERTERPATVEHLIQMLMFEPDAGSPELVPEAQTSPANPVPSPAVRGPRPPTQWSRVAVGASVATACLLLALGGYWLRGFKSTTQALVAGALSVTGEAKATNATPVVAPPPTVNPASASPVARDGAFTNSLGMPFVPVPNTQSAAAVRPGRFCRWLTRVQDFEAFVRATGHNAADEVWSFGPEGWKQRGQNWRTPGFEQTGMHPVSGVSWEDAQAFAKWLTAKEQAEGRLAPGERYRLPYDWEWSVAVGLAETRDGLPKDRNLRIKDVFPWGTQWPPPARAGNYGNFIPNFRDGFERSSPVGSFPTNRFGLHDMGGNLWQWCEDWFDAERVDRPLRGGSWSNDPADTLWSSYRHHIPPQRRYTSNGFRLVLATEPTTSTNPALAGHEIVGYYGAANNGGTVLRIADKAPVSKGDRIRVTGMGVYDGEWTVLQAFPYKGPNDTRPLWGYQIGASPQVVPGFTGQGGTSLNRARLFSVPPAAGASAMSATNPPSAFTTPALAPASTNGPVKILPPSKHEILWNAKSDLANWQGDLRCWSVEDGLLTGRQRDSAGPRLNRSLTWTGGPVDDFELVVVYRTKGDGSAVLRYRFDENAGNSGEIHGFGVYLNDWVIRFRAQSGQLVETNQNATGKFYFHVKPTAIGSPGLLPEQLQQLRQRLGNGEVLPSDRPTTSLLASDKHDGWQELVVNAKGDRLTYWLNGRLTAAIKLGAPTVPYAVAVDSGFIQLNYSAGWGKPFEIQFKEIRLARLPKVPPIRITNEPPRSVVAPPPPTRIEAEQWAILEQQDCKARPQAMTTWGAQRWSGGAQLFCGTGSGGSLTVNLPAPKAGRYRLDLIPTSAPDFGIIQVFVNGVLASSQYDAYSREVQPARRLILPVQLVAGANRLQIRVVGKNPQSTGYLMAWDYLELSPLAP